MSRRRLGLCVWAGQVPDYQTQAVANYFKNVDPSTLPGANVTYCKGGRGTPDVCALGTGEGLVIHAKNLVQPQDVHRDRR